MTLKARFGMLLLMLSLAGGNAAQTTAPALSDQQISDSYIYLLGRLLVLRQEKLDFQEGFKWNRLIHRKPGDVAWPNPNLDVAYSEAWVAVDEKSCLVLTVPRVEHRYYTVQFLNGWGETVANVNERLFPTHPSGKFAVCLKGSQAPRPASAQLVEVPVKYMRVLVRVELGSDPRKAVALQRQFKIEPTDRRADLAQSPGHRDVRHAPASRGRGVRLRVVRAG
jgi:hypothetical protein